MRVSIMGQAAFGEAVLKRLQSDGIEIAGVSAPEPHAGARPDALWAAAGGAGLPLVATATLKAESGVSEWRAVGADLCVMAFVTEIIPGPVLSVPRLGSIQYHPSLLPLHRGSSAMNWAIINGDTETGLTIFWPDSGIDTGPVLLQQTIALGDRDTVGSIYFDRLFPMGVDAIAESVAMVDAGTAPRLHQDHARATYEPPLADEHAAIHWYKPAHRLSALIRGCNPQPGAWTTFDDRTLRIFDCELTGAEEPGLPGKVLRVDESGFDVRLNGGVLRVLRVQPAGQKKLAAGEWAASAGLAPGFRFR